MFTPSDCKCIGIRKVLVAAKTEFLYWTIQYTYKSYIVHSPSSSPSTTQHSLVVLIPSLLYRLDQSDVHYSSHLSFTPIGFLVLFP